MTKLQRKLLALDRAEDTVIAELRRLYPEGTDLRVILMSGQVHPSYGCVIGHPGGRYALVTVRLESRTRDVRQVSAHNILGRA